MRSRSPRAVLKGPPHRSTGFTGDAEFRWRAICQTIRGRQCGDPIAVEADQPALMAGLAVACDALFPGTDLSPARGAAAP